MKLKKLLALITVMALMAATLAGCGSTADTSDNAAVEKEGEDTAEPAADSENTAVAAEAIVNAATTTKTVSMGDSQIEVEVTDIGKSGTFTYWSAFTGDSAAWDQERVDAFNEAYADLGIKCEVQFVPDGAGINNGKLLSAIAGGTAPDLLVTDNATSSYQYAVEGCFEPLDDILEAINLDVSQFYDGCKDVMYYNDTCYLVPQDTNVIMLYYNPDIASECGLDPSAPPQTLTGLDEWADAMTVQEADGSYSRFGLIPWLDSGSDAFVLPYIFGADPYNAESGKIDLTSDAMLGYMDWVQSYAKKYDPEKINAFTSGLGGMFSPDHAFMTGKVGMTFTGNWFSNALKIYAPDVKFEVTAVPVPEGGRANSTTFGSNVFAIPKGSPNADLAALFIKFCEQGSVNEDNFSEWRSIPVIDAAFDDVSLTKNGDAMYALEREIANSPENGIPALCGVSAELSQEFVSVREKLIYDTSLDPKTELSALQEKMQATLDAK